MRMDPVFASTLLVCVFLFGKLRPLMLKDTNEQCLLFFRLQILFDVYISIDSKKDAVWNIYCRGWHIFCICYTGLI